MQPLMSRRLPKYLAVTLIVAQVGCAAKKDQAVPLPPGPSISDQDRTACEAFARQEAERVGAVDAPSINAFMQAGPIGAMIDAGLAENHNTLARKYAHDAAEAQCLRPVVLAATLGPEHPDVAAALRDLAIDRAYHEDYRAAQSLYARALAIQERAFGPNSDDVATTLEWYGRLLRAMHRDEEAAFVETRARGIRVNAERPQGSEAATPGGAPAGASQQPPAGGPIPPAAE